MQASLLCHTGAALVFVGLNGIGISCTRAWNTIKVGYPLYTTSAHGSVTVAEAVASRVQGLLLPLASS